MGVRVVTKTPLLLALYLPRLIRKAGVLFRSTVPGTCASACPVCVPAPPGVCLPGTLQVERASKMSGLLTNHPPLFCFFCCYQFFLGGRRTQRMHVQAEEKDVVEEKDVQAEMSSPSDSRRTYLHDPAAPPLSVLAVHDSTVEASSITPLAKSSSRNFYFAVAVIVVGAVGAIVGQR